MIVIIEGLDGVGKTTLSKELVKKYNLKYIKESYTSSTQEKIKRFKQLFNNLFEQDIYVYDRCSIIDDIVYNFLDSQDSVYYNYFDIIQSILSHCIIIHLTLDEQTRQERLNERGDDYITNDMIKIIDRNYHNLYKKLNLDIKYINLEEDIDKNINKIYENITYRTC